MPSVGRKPLSLTTKDLLNLDGEDFINEVYFRVLGRKPDLEGLTTNLELLRQKFPKIEILKGIRNSPEGQQKTPALSDLDRVLKWHEKSKIRFIGWPLRILRKLRSIPQKLWGKKNQKIHLKKISNLPPHAKDIYRRLKLATLNHQ